MSTYNVINSHGLQVLADELERVWQVLENDRQAISQVQTDILSAQRALIDAENDLLKSAIVAAAPERADAIIARAEEQARLAAAPSEKVIFLARYQTDTKK